MISGKFSNQFSTDTFALTFTHPAIAVFVIATGLTGFDEVAAVFVIGAVKVELQTFFDL